MDICFERSEWVREREKYVKVKACRCKLRCCFRSFLIEFLSYAYAHIYDRTSQQDHVLLFLFLYAYFLRTYICLKRTRAYKSSYTMTFNLFFFSCRKKINKKGKKNFRVFLFNYLLSTTMTMVSWTCSHYWCNTQHYK